MEDPDQRSPAPGDWSRRLRRWWSTWVWLPAPPERREQGARGAVEAGPASTVSTPSTPEAAPEPTRAPEPLAGTIYLLPVSHLDTQWRWTVRETAARLLPETVRANAAAFDRYPSYRVNFDGAFRYRLLMEHHPAAYAELKLRVGAGRWCVAGATWDAMDVNLPGVESLVRQVLYGRRWFRQHLGTDPRDLFLPDCFGFGAQVPVVAAHCGLVGFATSKLRRFGDMRSAVGIPFPIGWWEGLDGSRLLAALDPGGYGEPLARPPADDPEVQEQLRRHHRQLGSGVAVRFFGIGDRGGAPDRRSLEKLERAVAGDGPVKTVAAGSDETFRQLAADLPADRLPVHRGELLLTLHGTGCYTSQVGMKGWNARNERLAAAAERAAAAAAWLGGKPYPATRLRDAWQRFLWHQFHDDLTGTSIPAAYRISWHDEAIAASVFGEVLRAGVASVARALDTRAAGVPLVVFNPLARPRRELVAARVPWGGGAAVAVIGPDGEAVPAQVESRASDGAVVRFVAELPALGFAVFDVRELEATAAVVADDDLRTLPRGLESSRYRLLLDGEGNLSSLFDRLLDRELLAAPLRLELFADRSRRFPAWEVRWEDLERGPLARVGGPATVELLPSGPAAVALEVRRRLGPSTFVERYRLPAAANGVESEAAPVAVSISCRWHHRRRLLKLTLSAAAGARDAVYDTGVAGVARPRSGPSLYEVPAQAWADLADEGGGFGVALLTDRAGGWDHPAKQVLRRTLVHTPATGRRFPHQGFQDLGDHHWSLALAAHRGDHRQGRVPALGEGFRHPPSAFVVPSSPGPLGRAWSFLAVEGTELAALKQHEDGGEWVLRLLDPTGKGGRARISFGGTVAACRGLDGCEDSLVGSPGTVDAAIPVLTDGAVIVDRPPFRPLTIGVSLASPAQPQPLPRGAVVDLALDRTVVTRQGEPCAHGLGRAALAFPAELWPASLEVDGTAFRLAPGGAATAQALACDGQRLRLPAGRWERLWLLATSAAGEQRVELRAGGAGIPALVPSALEPLAQEDEAIRFGIRHLAVWRPRPGYRRAGAVAWTVDHGHDRHGRDVAYTPLSLFTVSVALAGDADAGDIALPVAPQLLVFAATVTAGEGDAVAADVEEAPAFDQRTPR